MNETTVKAFLGLDCRDDLISWSENNSALCANIDLLDGRLTSRKGYAKIYDSSLDKDNVLGAWDYREENDDIHTVYAVADSSSCVLQSGDSGMAVIKTGLYPFAPWDEARMNAQLFLVNGVNNMLQIAGDEEYRAGMVAPTAAPTFNSNINGNLSQSVTYYFVYTYYNSALGKESNRSPVSAAMTTGSSSSTDGIRINIPANASVDSQVDAVRVYRTFEDPAAGSAGPYFFDQEADYSGSAITVDSIQIDDSLTSTQAPYAGASSGQASDYSEPPICASAEDFGGSIWLAGSYVHTTGNVDVTNGSSTVSTGATSPQFDTDMAGALFRVDGDDREYTISAVASATSLTLTENYEGTTGSDKSYYIYRDGTVLAYSLYENNTAKPWAFPTANREYVPEINNVTALRKTAAYMLVFGRNIIQKIIGTYGAWQKINLKDGIGCVGKRALCTDGGGNVIFYSGDSVWITDGVTVTRLDSERKADRFFEFGVDHDMDELAHMQYVPAENRVYLWLTSKGGSTNDTLLEYDVSLGAWIISNIQATCSALITNESTGDMELVFGDSYGFVYYDKRGKNYGAGTSGTLYGAPTGASSTTLTDSAATFNTTGDGLKGVRVYIASGTGAGQYGTIQSNTNVELTVDAWSGGVTPDTSSFYIVGAIDAFYYSKVYDFDDPVARKKITRIATNNTKDARSDYFYIQTLSGISADGTLSVTNGSADVAGTNTAFSTDHIGLPIRINNEWEEYRITAVASETSITLNKAYKGDTASGLRYQMPKHSQRVDMSSNDFCQSFPKASAGHNRHFQIRFGNLSVNQAFTLYGYTIKHEVADWNRAV